MQAINPEGYVNNREITNLGGHFLVKGSKNTKIVNKEKVVVRPGYERLGAAGTVKQGIDGSIDWKTNTNVYRNLRSYWAGGVEKAELEVLLASSWERVINGLPSANMEFVPWWSSSELMDLLIIILGDEKIRMWSGGVAEVASVTSTTITKKGYLAGTTYAFNDNGINNDTITDTTNGFVDAGFAAGDTIKVAGSVRNDGEYVIKSVTASTITLEEDNALATEAAGADLTIGWLNNGTWAESRFLVNTANRSVRIAGIDYSYTGGENTGTLTGLTRNPIDDGIVAGDRVTQSVMEFSPTPLIDYQADVIEVFNNHIVLASYTSRRVYISANDDYTDFTYTTPVRKPGEGFLLTFDSTPNGLLSDEDELYVSAGDDDWYRVFMELNSDQQGETVIIKKLKTAPGQAANGPGAIARIKNYVAYLSKAKAVDSLGQVENLTNVESKTISDDIRDDFLSYDLTKAHLKYWRESLYIALPAEQLLLEYDLRYGHWQPPYTMPIARLAIIDDQLCGHSSNDNETFILEKGFNDDGVAFPAIAAFGYENFGGRFSLKNFSESGHELYMSRNTVVKKQILYDYRGATGIEEREIKADDSSDPTVFEPAVAGPLGTASLGELSLGGQEIDPLVKKREVNLVSFRDFFERQVVFSTETQDGRFEILAYGENINVSENDPSFIKR